MLRTDDSGNPKTIYVAAADATLVVVVATLVVWLISRCRNLLILLSRDGSVQTPSPLLWGPYTVCRWHYGVCVCQASICTIISVISSISMHRSISMVRLWRTLTSSCGTRWVVMCICSLLLKVDVNWRVLCEELSDMWQRDLASETGAWDEVR